MGAARTLSGSGTVLGNVATTASGATIQLGSASAIGTLAVTGNLSLVGGTTLIAKLGTDTTPGGTSTTCSPSAATFRWPAPPPCKSSRKGRSPAPTAS
jgi:hypothetical protein